MANAKKDIADSARMVGRCEMFDEIACGGMATIHIGRMRGAGGFSRTVAIKRMHPHISRNPDFVAMFLDEASIVARVSHPNVVSTLDLVEDDGDLFIIMEYIEGLSLSALLRAARGKGERAPLNVTARIVIETLRGLHAAHEATDEDGEAMNIVHRDVSPENVLVGVDGYPRMLDFGVARASVRLSATRDGQVKGKVAYMAPEQVLGKEVDRRTDVYAVSAILWQALTGRRLWKADHLVQLAHRMLNDPIPPPSAVSPDVPKCFDAIVLRGLDRDVTQRWQTAAAMADALEDEVELASHRAVGLWVRRLGSEHLAELATIVAAVEAKDKARRAAEAGRMLKSSTTNRSGVELKQAALLAEAERDGPKGPPIPENTGQASGVLTRSDDLLWGKSDEHDAAASGSEPSEPATAAPTATREPAEGSTEQGTGAASSPADDEEAVDDDDDAATIQISPDDASGRDKIAEIRARLKAGAKLSPPPAAKLSPPPAAKLPLPPAAKLAPAAEAKLAPAAEAKPPPPAVPRLDPPATPTPEPASKPAPERVSKPVPAPAAAADVGLGAEPLVPSSIATDEEQASEFAPSSEPHLESFTAWPRKKIGTVAGLAAGVVILILIVRAYTSEDASTGPAASASAVEASQPSPPTSPSPSASAVGESPPPASATETAATATPTAASSTVNSEPPVRPVRTAPPVKTSAPPKDIYSQD